MNALVFAGGSPKGLVDDASIPTKALIDINGRPMLDYILDALRGAKKIEKIMVVLPSSVHSAPWFDKIDVVIQADGSLTENFYAGLSRLDLENTEQNKKVLAVSADIPLLTSEAVDDFLNQCEKKEASVYYPIVSKEAIEKKHPNVERTYMTLYDGRFTGGNLFLFDPRVAAKNKDVLKRAGDARKSPLKLIKILGLEFIIKFIFHLLTVKGLEEKISSVIGAKGVAINTSYVEISIDVDKVSDLELVRAKLAKEK